MDFMNIITYPFDASKILMRKKAIKRQLLAQSGLMSKRIAILSGSTVGDIKDVLEIFLLHFGINPQFYIGHYNRFYEDVVYEDPELVKFKPELVYINTSTRNLSDNAIWDKLELAWSKIKSDYSCPIVQNNFELPSYNIEVKSREVNELNIRIDKYTEQTRDFYINDVQCLSARFGLDKWFNEQDYFLYKYAVSTTAIPLLCYNTATIIKSIYGKNKKCLVLDLDNTLWGGNVGDVGVAGIELGVETAVGEAFVTFQRYLKLLHDKGVILTICSKNDERIAMEAFNNPNMYLRLDDITIFCANWENKADNVIKISSQLNILPESIVFIDDNPAERELVRKTLPEVEVPDANSPIDFIAHIEGAGYFYAAGISDDDRKRNEYYAADIRRNVSKSRFIDYSEYLYSLEMSGGIHFFEAECLERITQLINKTNQFNLTARRYSQSEIERISVDSGFIALYATLDDKFGSNGIVSALIGEVLDRTLHIRLWVMSCRVFKRDLELAVFDRLVEISKGRDLDKIVGHYVETGKNAYVANLLYDLGFEKITDGTWRFDLTDAYQHKNTHIKIDGSNK